MNTAYTKAATVALVMRMFSGLHGEVKSQKHTLCFIINLFVREGNHR